MRLETDLFRLPPQQWIMKQVVVFDWQDGPREGICLLEEPHACFYYKVFATRELEDDLNDCLFRVSEIQPVLFPKIIETLSDLGAPNNRVWAPIWRFSSDQRRKDCENRLEQLLSGQKPSRLIVQSRSMTEILECWAIIAE